jgi:hypothetical protein
MSPLYTYNGKLLIKDGALATSQSCCCNGASTSGVWAYTSSVVANDQCPPSSFYDSLCVSIDIQSYGKSLQASGQLFNNATWSEMRSPNPPNIGGGLNISCTNGIVTLYAFLSNNGGNGSITLPFSGLISTHTINYYSNSTTPRSVGTMTVTFSNPPC